MKTKAELMTKITRVASKAAIKAKKYSPEALVVVGVVGVVASAVMACKATTKAGEVVEELKENVDKIHEASELADKETYSEEDAQKDTTIVYTQAAVKFAKLYGPSIALGALSITCIVASHNILRKRNVALAAAYAGIDKSFKEYRGRVVERFGKELDRELRYNIKAKEVEATVVNEDGTETTKKTVTNVADISGFSDYARFYDDGCKNWDKDAEMNLMFLKQQQNYANDILKSKGYLFLNDVYDMLGIPRTKAGQVVGWVYDEKNPVGDNYVDFGIYDMNCEPATAAKRRDFVNGYERTILLDFNVDGNILDLI